MSWGEAAGGEGIRRVDRPLPSQASQRRPDVGYPGRGFPLNSSDHCFHLFLPVTRPKGSRPRDASGPAPGVPGLGARPSPGPEETSGPLSRPAAGTPQPALAFCRRKFRVREDNSLGRAVADGCPKTPHFLVTLVSSHGSPSHPHFQSRRGQTPAFFSAPLCRAGQHPQDHVPGPLRAARGHAGRPGGRLRLLRQVLRRGRQKPVQTPHRELQRHRRYLGPCWPASRAQGCRSLALGRLSHTTQGTRNQFPGT